MSLLTICQAIAEEVGLNAPTSIIGSSDTTAKQLSRLANREGAILAKMAWNILVVEYTFTTTNGTASYPLPSDYAFHFDDTIWDRSNYWKMRGPLNAQEWQQYKSGIVTTGVRRRFRIKGNLFYVDPTPTVDGNTLVYEYVSNKWCTDTTGVTGKTAFAVDTDIAKISEELISLGLKWRFLKAKGLDYGEEFKDYQEQVSLSFARDGGKPTIDMGAPALPVFGFNVPESGLG